MSVILSGPKRIYVLLLFWDRLVNPCETCPRSLQRAARAVGVEGQPTGQNACRPLCRVVKASPLSRTFSRRLFGISLLILDSQA